MYEVRSNLLDAGRQEREAERHLPNAADVRGKGSWQSHGLTAYGDRQVSQSSCCVCAVMLRSYLLGPCSTMLFTRQ